MDTTKRSPLDRLLFATFLKGRTSSRDLWEKKGDMTPEDNQKIIEETNEIINDDSNLIAHEGILIVYLLIGIHLAIIGHGLRLPIPDDPDIPHHPS